MLAPEQLSIGDARRAIAARPLRPYDRVADFWKSGAHKGVGVAPANKAQPALITQWIAPETNLLLSGVPTTATALFAAHVDPVPPHRRTRGTAPSSTPPPLP